MYFCSNLFLLPSDCCKCSFFFFKVLSRSLLFAVIFLNKGIYKYIFSSKHCFCCTPWILVYDVFIFIYFKVLSNLIFFFRLLMRINFHILVTFPNFFLLVLSNFIPLSPENCLCTFNFIKICFMVQHTVFFWRMHHMHLRQMYILPFYRCVRSS